MSPNDPHHHCTPGLLGVVHAIRLSVNILTHPNFTGVEKNEKWCTPCWRTQTPYYHPAMRGDTTKPQAGTTDGTRLPKLTCALERTSGGDYAR